MELIFKELYKLLKGWGYTKVDKDTYRFDFNSSDGKAILTLYLDSDNRLSLSNTVEYYPTECTNEYISLNRYINILMEDK